MDDHRRHSARNGYHASRMGTRKVTEHAAPRLYLVTAPVGGPGTVADGLVAALQATDVAAVLLRLAEGDDAVLAERIAGLRNLIQSSGAALLLDGHPGLVAPTQADGAHLTGIEAFSAAASSLKPARIAGCGGLKTRHDAMLAGESGADYVMFGEPDTQGHRPGIDAVRERVNWWAEVFEVPCVAFAGGLDELEALVRDGADFVAIDETLWRDGSRLATAIECLGLAEPVR